MKKPLARLLLTILLLVLVLSQVSALQLPLPLNPPLIDIPKLTPPTTKIDPPVNNDPPVKINPPVQINPINPGIKPLNPPIVIPPTTKISPPDIKPLDPGLKPLSPPLKKDPPVEPPKIPTVPGGGTNQGKPSTSIPSTGKFVTTEGPLFLMYRGDLTKGYEMFTPLDLSVDGEYYIPLISNAMHKVGEVKLTVQNGIVIASPLVSSGVTLSKDFMTFFPDIAGVKTINTSKLKKENIPFGVPVDVGIRFNTDPKVLLYVNCAIKYKTNLAGITPFSLENPEYLERMYALIALMD